MKKERMVILKMVNDGKITVDEAVKLIDSIKTAKAIDMDDVISTVKEKVVDIVEETKPVVKKCASKAKEVGEDVYNKGKAKIDEYKTKAKNSDFVDEVIITPAEDIIDEVKGAAKDVAEATQDAAEYVADTAKDSVKDIVNTTETAIDNAKENLTDKAEN